MRKESEIRNRIRESQDELTRLIRLEYYDSKLSSEIKTLQWVLGERE